MITHSRSGRSTLIVAAVLAAATTACTSAGPRAHPPPPAESLTRVAPEMGKTEPSQQNSGIPQSLRIRPGPLDAYVMTSRDRAVLSYAEEILTARCMRERGFDYPVPRLDAVVEYVRADWDLSNSRWFGIVDVGQASEYGYGDPPVTPSLRYRPATQEEQRALTGDVMAPPGSSTPSSLGPAPTSTPSAPVRPAGCIDVARAELSGADAQQVLVAPLADTLKVQATFRAQAKPRYFHVLEDWGACMRQKGYEITNPAKPGLSPAFRSAITSRAPGEPAPKAEVALALADIGCKEKVNLVQRLMALINEESATLAESNAVALDEQQDLIEKALKDASRLLGGNDETGP